MLQVHNDIWIGSVWIGGNESSIWIEDNGSSIWYVMHESSIQIEGNGIVFPWKSNLRNQWNLHVSKFISMLKIYVDYVIAACLHEFLTTK